jgi:hypothetical protein
MIILPGHPLFESTITELQYLQMLFNSENEYCFIAVPDSEGLIQAVTPVRAKEYIFDGEYKAQLEQFQDE